MLPLQGAREIGRKNGNEISFLYVSYHSVLLDYFTVNLYYSHNFFLKMKERKKREREKGRVEMKDFYASYNYMQFGLCMMNICYFYNLKKIKGRKKRKKEGRKEERKTLT